MFGFFKEAQKRTEISMIIHSLLDETNKRNPLVPNVSAAKLSDKAVDVLVREIPDVVKKPIHAVSLAATAMALFARTHTGIDQMAMLDALTRHLTDCERHGGKVSLNETDRKLLARAAQESEVLLAKLT